MITIEQIRLLEQKINKAVDLIRSLKEENKTLRRAVTSAQSRMRELEKLVGDFKSDQQEIEQCILRALENLDRLEEEVSERKGRRASSAGAAKPEAEAKAEAAAAAQELPPGLAGGSSATSQDEAPAAGDGAKELDIF